VSKTIRIEYYGIEGEGATVKEAKANAGQSLIGIVRDLEEGPLVVSFRGWAKMIWRGKYGWNERFIQTEGGPIEMGSACLHGGGSREDAVVHATRHIADCAWTFEVEDDAAYAAEAFAKLPRGRRDEAVREFLYRIGWQRRVRAAMDAGWSQDDARCVADGLQHLVPAERHPKPEA
jgi:hypothetical protein